MLQQLILKILESIGFKILRFKKLPSSISFQKSKYQIKEFKIFDVWWKFHWIFENLMKNKTMVLWWPLTIRNKGCSVASRFSDEVVLVMVDSGAKSKNEQSVINSWSRCDIDTCGLSLRRFTYSRTAPCKCRYSSF